MQKLSVIIYFLGLSFFTKAQLNDGDLKLFSTFEDSLQKLENSIVYNNKESSRFNANKQFLALWQTILANEKSMQYPFDSLKGISRLVAPDKKFRILTWNIFKEDGTHAYFGFIQVNNIKTIKKNFLKKETTTQYEVFQLLDKSSAVKTPESYLGEPSKWFGMLYFDVIKTNDDFYTLFGWDGNDKLTVRKFIDVLSFKTDGTPQFGKDVFKYQNKFNKRIMFEYASEVAMSLKYNSNRKQIIFSHLAPNTPDPTLVGQYQYYGPDGSFDAFDFRKGKWNYIEDVDIRNEKVRNDNVKKPDPKKQTPFYKPK